MQEVAIKNNYAIDFDIEQKKIIMNQFFPKGTTEGDMQFCMSAAKTLGLNPILNEIYFVERKQQINGQWVSKVAPMAGKNAWLKLAHAHKEFDGIESETIIKKVPKFVNGEWVEVNELVGIATVYRTDKTRPIKVEVLYSEYVQFKKDGTPTQFWAEKPHTMLKKVAESQALRMAFNVSGLYDESELPQSEESKYESVALKNALENSKKEPKKMKLRQNEVAAQNVAESIEADLLKDIEVEIPHNPITGEVYKPNMAILDRINADGTDIDDDENPWGS